MKNLFGETFKQRREQNNEALKAFGISTTDCIENAIVKNIREGTGPTVFTIGYERRDGEELMSVLREAGVDVLVDIRERPMSRKPDFRKSSLTELCEDFGLEYQSWTILGSTKDQRDQLKETKDIKHFHKRFRQYAKRKLESDIQRLGAIAKKQTIALLCYERCHEDCHRMVISNLLADHIDAEVLALQ